jgi:hypothetical protein
MLIDNDRFLLDINLITGKIFTGKMPVLRIVDGYCAIASLGRPVLSAARSQI